MLFTLVLGFNLHRVSYCVSTVHYLIYCYMHITCYNMERFQSQMNIGAFKTSSFIYIAATPLNY